MSRSNGLGFAWKSKSGLYGAGAGVDEVPRILESKPFGLEEPSLPCQTQLLRLEEMWDPGGHFKSGWQ